MVANDNITKGYSFIELETIDDTTVTSWFINVKIFLW